MSVHRGKQGFTTLEIIAVLLLIAIISAVSLSRIMDTQADLYAETEVTKNHLRFAQMKAMNSNNSWGIDFGGNTYTLEEAGAASATPFPGEDSSTYALPAGMTATASSAVVFDEWGSPGSSSITVTLAGSGSRTITITKNTGFIP